MDRKSCLFLLTSVFFSTLLCGQDAVQTSSPKDTTIYHAVARDSLFKSRNFVVGEIAISGDRKTKRYLIERELPFKTGDSLALDDLVSRFDLARQRLMNTRLFNDAVISLKNFDGYQVNVQIDLKERWYIFPVPYFRPIDRNLQEWAKRGYDLSRVNYGAKFDYYNFTGRNDKLKAWFITGYTRQIEFSYEQPNADKSLKHGYGVNVSYATAREINHLTLDNEQKFIPYKPANDPDTSLRHLFNGQILSEIFNTSISYTYRPAIKTRHQFKIGYFRNRVDAAVIKVNPQYFNNGKQSVAYPEFSYSVDYNNTDYVAYPLKGFIGDAQLVRKGISKDINIWQLTAKGTRGWEIGNKLYYGLQGYGLIKLPFDQPYFNQRAFGYGDLYLRGLENM